MTYNDILPEIVKKERVYRVILRAEANVLNID